MVRKVTRVLIAGLGLVAGGFLVLGISNFLEAMHIFNMVERLLPLGRLAIYIMGALAGGIAFYFVAPVLIDLFTAMVRFFEEKLSNIPAPDILYGTLGLLVGFVLAFLVSNLFRMLSIPWLSTLISVLLYLLLGYLGAVIVLRKRQELSTLMMPRRMRERAGRIEKALLASPKILDTSVIIDGRIFDICKTGIVEGTLIIPGFVLNELRHIADSADALKRNRGRRGLDILNKIQEELDIPVKVEEKDYDDLDEVDAKLLRLADEIGGAVVTNDFNLNKVAAVHKVRVFNINDLANAVKPMVLPGEEMTVTIVKDGKEAQQGVAYLDDGTMIVVDGAKRHINEQRTVVVTSVLQTSAGRMIFAKLKATG